MKMSENVVGEYVSLVIFFLGAVASVMKNC